MKANKLGVLVHKVIARTRDKHFIRKVKAEHHSSSIDRILFIYLLQLKILSTQILHRSPDFSFGLFSFDWSFLYGVGMLVMCEVKLNDPLSSKLSASSSAPF